MTDETTARRGILRVDFVVLERMLGLPEGTDIIGIRSGPGPVAELLMEGEAMPEVSPDEAPAAVTLIINERRNREIVSREAYFAHRPDVSWPMPVF